MIASIVFAAVAQLITIPSGWQPEKTQQSIPYYNRELGDWANPSSGEAISVEVMPTYGASLVEFAKLNAGGYTKETKGAISLLSSGPLELCNGRAGYTQSFSLGDGGGLRVVYVLAGTRAYVGAYAYPGYPGESSEGKAAIESLCPPSEPKIGAQPPIDSPPKWPVEDVGYVAPPGRVLASWLLYPPSKYVATQWISVMEVPMAKNHALSYGVTYFLSEMMENPTVVTRSPLPLCGGLDGVAIEVRGLRNKKPVDVLGVVTVSGKNGYFALYNRQATEPADPGAIHAIRSLCPSSHS